VPRRKAEHYRQQADECREQAERALRAEDRESLLKLAAKWQKLTDGSEQHVAQLAQQPGVKAEG
jgi:phage shock protein A